jgi:hypothetical protein
MNSLQENINQGLDEWARKIDIPPHKYKLAEERFNRIKDHLEYGSYRNASIPPAKIYAQGSYRLGTIVRPLKDGEESDFDIDMVCEVQREKETGPELLKDDVGEEVQSYASQNDMDAPKDKRRCWTLEYAPDSDGIGFHVDVLPSVPDQELGILVSEQNSSIGYTAFEYTQTTIAITDKEKSRNPEYEWRSSNPDGYAKWFYGICQPGFTAELERSQKQLILEACAGIEGSYRYNSDVPNALLRTPLQRAVQILKRHRDVRFAGHSDEEFKPISMIITTLAAHVYVGQSSMLTTTSVALERIVEMLSEHASLLENRAILNEDVSRLRLIQRVGNKWYVPNPVNPHYPGDPDEKGENFADKWDQDNHARAKAFFQWVEWLKEDFRTILNAGTKTQLDEALAARFGSNAAKESIRKYKRSQTSITPATTTALSRFNVPHRKQPSWPEEYCYSVGIDGQATRQGFRTLNSDRGFNRIGKRFSLRFEAKTNVPEPYDVYWQVVNTGNEAEQASQLRGSIFLGSRVRTESTQYTGFHWVECLIVKNNICVARSGEFVVNIQ